VRVDDGDPAMLAWLRDQQVDLGVTLELVARRPFGGPFLVRLTSADGPRELDLGPALADALWLGEVVEGLFHRSATT
jgi:DtxR family Mn-dependent transcriptional regulator